jgi:hypothetical protein
LINISAVPRDQVNGIWPVVGPMLNKAITRTNGRWHNVDVLAACLEGTTSVWIAFDEDSNIIGTATITISTYPSGMKVGRMDYLGGHDRDLWFDQMWETTTNYARDLGCERFEVVCRKGLESYCKKYGMKPIGLFTELDLRKGNGHV